MVLGRLRGIVVHLSLGPERSDSETVLLRVLLLSMPEVNTNSSDT